MRSGWIFVLLAAAAPAAAQSTAPDEAEEAPVRLVWDDRPSIRAGMFRLDLRTTLQSDFRSAYQDLEREGGTYQTAQKRVGVSGRFTNRVQFEIDYELDDDNAWRDVFVNVEIARALEVRAGKFKMPFSFDELTGISRIDFVYRSLLAQTIAPARDIGVMAHGEVLRRIVTYQAGAFRNDGDNARRREPIFLLPGEEEPADGSSVAVRVTAEPFRHASGPRELRRLYLGVAFTGGDVAEGLNSLRGRSVFGTEFAERMYVSGRRRRAGAEVVWMPGPFSVKAEYARATEQRKRQGLLDNDLSDFVSSAWYLSGTWALTGESKSNDIEPRKPVLQGGFGAIELAVRYERLGFASTLKDGVPAVTPRADPLLENADTVFTFGVNWYLNTWGRIVVNGIREEFEDPDRTAVPGRTTNWAGVARLQFRM